MFEVYDLSKFLFKTDDYILMLTNKKNLELRGLILINYASRNNNAVSLKIKDIRYLFEKGIEYKGDKYVWHGNKTAIINLRKYCKKDLPCLYVENKYTIVNTSLINRITELTSEYSRGLAEIMSQR